jgi:hypothetical protein
MRKAATSPAASAASSESADVVHLDDARRDLGRHRGADIAPARDDPPAIEHCEGLVDRAVVVEIVHRDPWPARDGARPADHRPVRVGRGQRELPVREPEAPRHLRGDPVCVGGREHQRDAASRLPRDRDHGRRRRVAGHAAGVAEAEIDVFVPIDIRQARTRGALDMERVVAGPLRHPVHRHAEELRRYCPRGERGACRATRPKRPLLAFEEAADAPRIDARAGLHAGSPASESRMLAATVSPETAARPIGDQPRAMH